jgi:hypothetical protein
MSGRLLPLVLGLVIAAAGVYLVLSPLVVADALGRPHATSTQMINLRASWGGVVLGIGAFVAWLPAARPRARLVLGLLMWLMAGIGVARAIGFAIDGHPDSRQYLWLGAEAALVVGSALGLRQLARRARSGTIR